MSESTRGIAERLAALPDSALAALFAARGVAPKARWNDLFDAADDLTGDASIAAALATLSAAELRALAHPDVVDASTAAAATAALRALLLTDADGAPLPEVLRAVAPVSPTTDVVLPPASASAPDAAATAAERAFTSVDAMGDIILAALHEPLALLASGMIGATDRKRLAEDATRPDDIDDLLGLARSAQLLVAEERALLPTAAAERWLREPTPARWLHVAAALLNDIPLPLRGGPPDASTPWADAASWPAAYPADPAWPGRAGALRARATTWGVLAEDRTEPPWTAALRVGDDASAAAALTAAFPHEVDRIYLQNDLSAISPGPLASALDVRLRTIARRESHAQASSYRFTADTVTTALAEGETEESILDFLAGLSLTGVPQPLEYLVRTTAQRYGAVRVGADETGRAVVTADPGVLDTLAIDQTLRPLGLVRDGAALRSRAGRDTVLWTLVDARYPAVAVDARGEIEVLSRHRVAGATPRPHAVEEAYAPLIARLREADSSDADAAWLGRELESAVRARAVVDVEVELPGGETRAFVLEATGLGGGRLRGREIGADIERTLPVSSIRSVTRR